MRSGKVHRDGRYLFLPTLNQNGIKSTMTGAMPTAFLETWSGHLFVRSHWNAGKIIICHARHSWTKLSIEILSQNFGSTPARTYKVWLASFVQPWPTAIISLQSHRDDHILAKRFLTSGILYLTMRSGKVPIGTGRYFFIAQYIKFKWIKSTNIKHANGIFGKLMFNLFPSHFAHHRAWLDWNRSCLRPFVRNSLVIFFYLQLLMVSTPLTNFGTG